MNVTYNLERNLQLIDIRNWMTYRVAFYGASGIKFVIVEANAISTHRTKGQRKGFWFFCFDHHGGFNM